MQDVMAGRVDYDCLSLPLALPQIAGKTVKAIALLSKQRSPILPDLPSAHEQGLTDFDIPSWYALFLPAATPQAIQATLAALDMPAVQERSERRSPGYLAQFLAAQIKKWEAPIKASGIQLED
jgi:tripartite-type tricarboxylate transporter receptor subunit TctC